MTKQALWYAIWKVIAVLFAVLVLSLGGCGYDTRATMEATGVFIFLWCAGRALLVAAIAYWDNGSKRK